MPHPRLATPRPRTILAAVATALLLVAAPAAAAPPPNDTPETAIDLTTFPFAQDIAIADAGTEPFDSKILRKNCGSEAAEGTVWYRFEAPAEGVFTFNVSTQEEWTAGVALVTDLPAGRKTLGLCGEGIIISEVQAGDEFWLAAFSRTPNPTGTLTVSAEFQPRASQPFVLTLESVTADAQTDIVTVRGTYQCSVENLAFGFVNVVLNPDTKRGGFGRVDITECSGQPEPFTIEATPDSGKLTGVIEVLIAGGACDDIGCDRAEETRRVKPRSP